MPTLQQLPHLTVEPKQAANAAVIWLHGIGADGHDFEPIVPLLKLPDQAAVRFVFPHAPVRPVTCNQGMPMRAWYDILELSEIRKINENDLITSAEQIASLIRAQTEAGIASKRIVLAGFSQGGAVAIHAALRYPEPLAGLFALSTYMSTGHTLKDEASPANRDIPIHMAHGIHDQMVTRRASRLAFEELTSSGYNVQWHEYTMGHEVNISEIRDISRWLTDCLNLT